MAYLVLARKWRPQSFADLIGQEHISRTLQNAIRSGRVHHAFLFTGARGVGKTSAARILAKALNCEAGPTPQPCNSCPSCQEITAGQNVDVFEIDGASNTGVDDIRELRENIRYLPSRSRFKIFIIDEVHMLSINAFNALLKTLEEPPPHAKFIFATTEPHKIPVTIHSRCQRFDFRKIPLVKVVERLKEIAATEGLDISDRALGMVATQGEGSMRDSLSTLDQVIAFCGEKILDEEVQSLLGMVDRRLLFDTVEALLQKDCRRALESIRRADDVGLSFRRFCQDLVEVCRSLILCRVLEQPQELIDTTPEELAELKALVATTTLEDLQRILTVLIRTEAELAVSSFPRLTLEAALIRLSQLPPARDAAALIRKLEELESKLGGLTNGAHQTAAEPPPPPPLPPELRPKKPEAPAPQSTNSEGWPGLVELAKKRRLPLGYLLENDGRLLALNLPTVEIGISRRSVHLVSDAEFLDSLRTIGEEYFNRSVTIKITAVDGNSGTTPPSLTEERKALESDRKKRLREDALEHPMIKAALKIFEAEVRDVRPIDKGFV